MAVKKLGEFPASGVWYGKPWRQEDHDELLSVLDSEVEEKVRVHALCELLKLGEFSVKPQLVEILTRSNNRDIRSFACRLLCSVAEHNDISCFADFLSSADEPDVKTFVIFSADTLSLQTLPYLLGLLEEWQGTELGESIKHSMQLLFPVSERPVAELSLSDFGAAYEGLAGQVSLETYYLYGKPVFPGALTQELISMSATARREKRGLMLTDVPTLLSVWSGMECPVDYATIVDDQAFGLVLDYVKQIAAMSWEMGRKYFYGRSV